MDLHEISVRLARLEDEVGEHLARAVREAPEGDKADRLRSAHLSLTRARGALATARFYSGYDAERPVRVTRRHR